MRRLAWPAALAALTLALYAPALGYGLIWDDPLWYGQVVGKTLNQLFFGLETYQFYRPLSLLLNQQFVTADGRIDAVAAHAVQLLVHLAAVLLLGPALRALGLRRWHSDLSALAFALYPAAFQAVAWQAPQGPWVLALSLGAITAAGRFARGRRLWVIAAALAFAAALLFQESALPLGAFVVWAGVGRGARGEERGARGGERGAGSEGRGARGEGRGARGEEREARSEGRGARGEERGARGEERGARGEERGARGGERGARGEERGARSEERGARGEERGARGEERGARGGERGARGEERGARSSVRDTRLALRSSPFALRSSPFALRSSPFALRSSPFALRPSPFALRPSPFALRSLLLLASVAAIALVYLIIWLNVPRDAGVTGEGRDPRVLAYFLQAVAWPVARGLAAPLAGWAPPMLAVSFGAVALALAGLLAARGEPLAALIGLAWVAAGLLPPWVGLSWEYVSYGERLTYVMAPGVAVLWAGLAAWLVPDAERRRMSEARRQIAGDGPRAAEERPQIADGGPQISRPERPPVIGGWRSTSPDRWTAVGRPLSTLNGLLSIGLRLFVPPAAALALTLYVGLALAQLRDFRVLYAAGTTQLARATTMLAAEPEARLLFINFPDRYELRAPYYPLGFWGIVLAPVIQDLRDFAVAAEGRAGVDVSRAAFVTGALEREAWPYRVDLRGVNAGPEELVDEAQPAARVLLSDYLPGGALALRDVGDVAEDAEDAALAASGNPADDPDQAAGVTFGDMVALRGAELGPTGRLELRWAALRQPDRDAAVFIHLWRDGAFVTDIGGDALGGLMPVWAWRPGVLIIDRRALPPELVAVPGLSIRVGLYNRVSGERYALEGAEGEDEAFEIAD